MRRCSIVEYDDETVVEFYNQETKERTQYKFNNWDSAIEALPELEH